MADRLKFKPSELSEVAQLAPRLRADDKEELKAIGSDPVTSLTKGIQESKECISVYTSKDLIIGMFGYSELNKNIAVIWFLGSDEIEKYPLTFVKEGKKFINRLLNKYEIAANCVYGKNKTHIEYIKRLGCTIDYENPVIVNQEIFFKFYKYRRK